MSTIDATTLLKKIRKSCPGPRQEAGTLKAELFDVDFGSCLFELGLDGGRFVFGSTFLDRSGCAFDKLLGFSKTETCNGLTDRLDHTDLVITKGGKNNVKCRFLFGCFATSTASRSCGNCDRGSSADSPFFLKSFNEFGNLEDCKSAQLIY